VEKKEKSKRTEGLANPRMAKHIGTLLLQQPVRVPLKVIEKKKVINCVKERKNGQQDCHTRLAWPRHHCKTSTVRLVR
jgi:hypothetical protein